MVKKGDTLIEVTIAIGIFSMIAIAVASVMSSGTSGSQMALETTLTREEIDAQAEALRFVHTSYVSSKNYKNEANASGTNPYQVLWQKIIDGAITEDAITTDITQFTPNSCDELYNEDSLGNPSPLQQQNAFVLNIKQLSSGASAYVSAKETDLLVPTSTYPRLLFGTSEDDNDDNDSLANLTRRDNLYRAEGIYVVAVRDSGTTNIVGSSGPTSAFYDFYIRTCWYGTDATRPSTISTVVRLYDPEISSLDDNQTNDSEVSNVSPNDISRVSL